MMHSARGLKMPAGIRWTAKRPCSLTTVWPALAPPWPRMTRSASRASRLMTLPLPSSPQWPPTTAVTGTPELYLGCQQQRRDAVGGVARHARRERAPQLFTAAGVVQQADDAIGEARPNQRPLV